jgi:hypothetical protein
MKLTINFVTQSAILALVALLLPCLTLAQYVRTDLVSDTDVGQNPADPNLVNGWGLVSLALTPFWVSDNGTGESTLYTGAGQKVPLTVTIPSTAGPSASGQPTGIVGNTAADPNAFVVSEGGRSGKAIFISPLSTARSAVGIPKLGEPALALMPPSRPTDQVPALLIRDWRLVSTEHRIFYTPPTMVRTGELTCSISGSTLSSLQPMRLQTRRSHENLRPTGFKISMVIFG